MSINFIKNIVERTVDADTHGKFTRFGTGNYPREEMKITFRKNVSIVAGPDYANNIVRLFAIPNSEEVTIKGKMSAKKGQNKRFEEAGINLVASRATAYTVEHTFSADEFRTFIEDFSDFLFLFTVESGANKIKIKPKVPRPGNLIEKSVNAKLDKSYTDVVKEEFLFDCEKDVISVVFKQIYDITEIIVDEALLASNPLQARLDAKRKGKLIRTIIIDDKEETKEYPLEA